MTSPKQPEPSNKGWKFFNACWDSFLEAIIPLKPLLNWAKEECKGIKKGWILFAVLMVFISWVCINRTKQWQKGIDDDILDKTNKMYQSTIDKTNQLYAVTFATIKQTLEDKEKEDNKLRQERDTANIQKSQAENALAPFQMLARLQFTNAPLTERLDLLFSQLSAITNAIALTEDKPIFELWIDDKKINDNSIVELGTNRILHLWAKNLGRSTVFNLSVRATFFTASTNVFLDSNIRGWHYGTLQHATPPTISFVEEAETGTMPGDFHKGMPIVFNNTLVEPNVPAYISIYSPKSPIYTYKVVISFKH